MTTRNFQKDKYPENNKNNPDTRFRVQVIDRKKARDPIERTRRNCVKENEETMNQNYGTAAGAPNYAAAGPKLRLTDVVGALQRAGIQLPVNVQVAGRVTYSHIRTMVDGEELVQANNRKVARGGRADNKPYYSLNVGEAQIIVDPSLPPEVKTYFEQRISHKQHDDGAWSHVFYATSKSPFPISIGWGPNSGIANDGNAPKTAPELEGELAAGVYVVMGMRIFGSQAGTGCGLDYIIINEPPRYFKGGGSNTSLDNALRAMGAIMDSGTAVPAPASAPAPAAAAPMPGQVTPQPADPTAGMSAAQAPVPGSAPMPNSPFMNVPEGDPAYQAQPQASAPTAAPGNAAAGAGAGTWGQGQPGIGYVRN